MITATQKSKILQVVNVFETGTKQGKYDMLVIYADGINNSRQITYGRSQTTEQGNLKALLQLYILKKGKFSAQFQSFINDVGKKSLVDNVAFKNLLRQSARQDVIMQNSQDEFFDKLYYQPAQHFFEKNLFKNALSMLVIYDSYIHSGSIPAFLRERFPENIPLNGGDEKKWIKQYVDTRHNWLETHSKLILRKTIYRTQCFKNQIASGNWDLSKVINANDILVS
jgi:chitosanase